VKKERNLLLALWVVCLGFSVQTLAVAAESSPPRAKASHSSSGESESVQKLWTRWAKVLGQAHAVEREAWWVLTDQKFKSKIGSFTRFQRALERQIVGLKRKKILSCEKFKIKKEIKNPLSLQMTGQLFEICRRNPSHILDFEALEKQSLKLDIYPEFQVDVYGLGVSIFNKRIECILKWNDSDVLTSLSCKNYQRNRNSSEIVELDTFVYKMDSKNLITMKGRVLENLKPTRKIESEVPLIGKITVTETELDLPVVKNLPPPPRIPRLAPHPPLPDDQPQSPQQDQQQVQLQNPPTATQPSPPPGLTDPPSPHLMDPMAPNPIDPTTGNLEDPMQTGPTDPMSPETLEQGQEMDPKLEGGPLDMNPPEGLLQPLPPPLPPVLKQSEPDMIESGDSPPSR
jgi:hypothetical protein